MIHYENSRQLPDRKAAKGEFVGVVEHGDQRGRLLGFPTANISISADTASDFTGVWAATAQLNQTGPGELYVAVVSVGCRPTYYAKGGKWLLEANLFEYSGDLYGKTVRIELFERLRAQRTFSNSRELTEQIKADVACTRVWAFSHNLDELLNPVELPRPKSRQNRQFRKGRKKALTRDEVQTIKSMRAQKNAELIQRALDDPGCKQTTYESLAARTGLPIGYLRWVLPGIEGKSPSEGFG